MHLPGKLARGAQVHVVYDRLREGYHESRRCSRDTYPESYITKYTSKKISLLFGMRRWRGSYFPEIRGVSRSKMLMCGGHCSKYNTERGRQGQNTESRDVLSAFSSYFRVKLGSPFNVFRRRWTVDLNRRSFFKTDDDEPRFSRTELEFAKGGDARRPF